MSNILRRGRLEAAQNEEILRYTSSMEADRWIFDADIAVDLAHTVMLREQDIINKEDCSKILSGLLRIREEGMEKLDFSYEDIHISLESRLIDMVGEDVGGRMHSGRSRNDEVATCIRLALREELTGLLEEIFALRKLFSPLQKNTSILSCLVLLTCNMPSRQRLLITYVPTKLPSAETLTGFRMLFRG